MVNEANEPLRFGELAIELGLLTAVDVERALRIQAFRRERNQPIPWLGEILESLGKLTAADTQRIFALLFERANRRPSIAAPLDPTRPLRSAG